MVRGTNWHDWLRGDDNSNILEGLNGNDTLIGEGGDDYLYGGNHNDKLFGNAGNDWMQGDGGDDSYYVEDAGDTVFEWYNAGKDKVFSSLHSYTLPNNVENLELIDNARFGYGNSLANELTGNSGQVNHLYGRSGDDTIYGGNQTDYLFGENNDDLLIGRYGDDNLFGNGHNDTLHGNHGNDSLEGGAHDDLLYGGNDNDTLKGGSGRDTLQGAYFTRSNEVDRLYGGGDADTFVLGVRGGTYYQGNGRAIIEDFNRAEGDKVQLSDRNRSGYSFQVGLFTSDPHLDTKILYNGDEIGIVKDVIARDANDYTYV